MDGPVWRGRETSERERGRKKILIAKHRGDREIERESIILCWHTWLNPNR